MLDQGGQAFDPVAIVAIDDAVDFPNFGTVNMATHHTLKAVFGGLGRHGDFKITDEIDGFFDF